MDKSRRTGLLLYTFLSYTSPRTQVEVLTGPKIGVTLGRIRAGLVFTGLAQPRRLAQPPRNQAPPSDIHSLRLLVCSRKATRATHSRASARYLGESHDRATVPSAASPAVQAI